jgi:GTPase-associated protein 1, N-terminal domain type 2/GTPase-associated protein 1, middle domain
MTTRYAQMSYTSFDTAGSAGGWRVKQTAGELADPEQTLLLSGVHTGLNAVEPIPVYPTLEQLQQIPRRLAYRRVNRDNACYWHSVPAGADHTGRPGNVFIHALLDRAAGAPDTLYRPIELWRSPRWLYPYGPTAVAHAELPADPPGPGGVVTRDSVVEFACDTGTWRLATLFGLLDAVAAAIDGGPLVVLGVDSVDTAAHWIGLVSFLMSPGTARMLNFSTFDRAEQLGLAMRVGQHLSAVPRDDLIDAPAGVVTIDETQTLSLGELGGEPHRTAAGQPISATAWSAMAQVAMLDPDSTRLLLADIDAFSARVTDAGLHPAWPMAMSVATRSRFADAADEARSVIESHSPRGTVADALIVHTITDVVRAVAGASTADALATGRNIPDGLAAMVADAIYLSRAICDDDWLDRPGRIPLGRTRYHRQPIPAELAAAIPAAVQLARKRGPEGVLRVADILARAGVACDLTTVLEDEVLPVLRDPQLGPRLIRRLGVSIGVTCRLEVATALLRPAPATDRPVLPVADDVLDWLAHRITAPTADELAEAQPGNHTWTRAVLCALRASQLGSETSGDRRAERWWLGIHPLGIHGLGIHGLSSSDLPDDDAAPREPTELLTSDQDCALPARELVRTLVGAPDSPAIVDLATRVLNENNDDAAVACAALRLSEPDDWIRHGYVRTHQPPYTPHWDDAVEMADPDAVHRDFARRLLVLAVVGVVLGAPCPRSCRSLLTGETLETEVVEQVAALVNTNALSANTVLAVSLQPPNGTAGLERLLRRVAARLAATFPWDADQVNDVANLMGQIDGTGDEESLRRLRQTVLDVLHGPADGVGAVAAQSRWGH